MADLQTTNYTLGPDGTMKSTGSPGMVDVTGGGASSLGTLAPHPISDPYAVFNSKLADMLTTAQNTQVLNMKKLGGEKDYLKTMSVAPGGAQPFNPTISSDVQVANREAMQSAFEPAITSISTQETNTAAALEGIKGTIGALQTATQPVPLSPGQSLVTREGKILKQGHSYSPQINPFSGLLDGFDQNTGTWASQDAGTATTAPPAPSDNSSLVGGVDFSGKATSTKPYATDPNYATEVDSLYNQITRSQPIPTATGLDQFIQSQIGGKSPVTGQMIISAATQYGIDPHLLAAVLGHESDFGTAGAGAKTMNAGNVGNTGTSTQNFKSWQQGVNAAAYEIARRMPGNSNATSPAPEATKTALGAQLNSEAAMRVMKLPAAMQNYVDGGPKGVAYINDDRVPTNLKQTVQTMASRAGIPYVQAADASALRSLQAVYDQLNSMETIANRALSHGGDFDSSTLGHIKDATIGQLAKYSQTPWGQDLNKLDSFRDTAIKAVQGLAGGAGSGLRINMGEINANLQALPTSSDSLQSAKSKLNLLRSFLDTQLSTTFPYIPAGNVSAGSSGGQGGFTISTGGSIYSFPDQQSLDKFKSAAGL